MTKQEQEQFKMTGVFIIIILVFGSLCGYLVGIYYQINTYKNNGYTRIERFDSLYKETVKMKAERDSVQRWLDFERNWDREQRNKEILEEERKSLEKLNSNNINENKNR